MAVPMNRQQEVLAYLGEALLAVQIVGRFFVRRLTEARAWDSLHWVQSDRMPDTLEYA